MKECSFKLKEIKLELTHNCPLQCVHCSSASDYVTKRKMSWAACRKILDEAALIGVEKVAFSGGEPLLWRDLSSAVALSKSHGMDVSVYSSGAAPNSKFIFSELHDEGLNKAIFSLFSSIPEEHDKITQVAGSANWTLEVAKHCVEIGLETEFHFVPMVHNYRRLPDIVRLSHRIGIKRVSVLRLVPQGRGADMNGELSRYQNIELRKTIIDLRKKGRDIRVGSPYNILMLSSNPKCYSGIDRLTIGPDLSISPCDAFKSLRPSDLGVSPEYSCLDEHSLNECWTRSAYLRFIRNYVVSDLPPECLACKKVTKCQSGCAAQKLYAFGEFKKVPDPMCLMRRSIENRKKRAREFPDLLRENLFNCSN